MNQISLYNKSTDSKLSIEAEELTRSRNIKIPKDGSFLLTNKTRLTEELADKYTVGPTGDFQELEEAVRVLCNMKEYSSRQKDVIVELQENYVFKPYTQFGMNAGFIVVRPKSPITLEVTNLNRAIFSVVHGAISPRFEQFTMNIKSTNTRLFDIIRQSELSFAVSTFNFNYQDNPGDSNTPLNFPFFLNYNSTSLTLGTVTFNIEINKDNSNMLNNGEPLYRWLSVCGENSELLASHVRINIKDYSNINDNSVTDVLPSGINSKVVFNGNNPLISYSTEHGGFNLVRVHSGGVVTMNSAITLTGNSKTSNQNSRLVLVYNSGTVDCTSVQLVNCGSPGSVLKNAFSVDAGSAINITGYRNNNSHFSNLTNVQVNTLTSSGIIYN